MVDSGLGRPCGACGPSRALTPLPFFRGEERRRRARRYLSPTDSRMRSPCPRPQGNRISPTSLSPGGGARDRRFPSSPLQGGGREGGPAPGCAGVPPASRETRTRMRAFGPPDRRDAGAPRRFTDERDREYPRPGYGPPGSGNRSEDGVSSAITLPRPPGQSHLKILRRLADIAVAGRGRARPPFSLLPPSGGRSGGGSRPPGAPASRRPRAKREPGRGPSARQAGGTPALPGNSPMSGIGKVPVRAAEPLGQPPSRPPPFQGGGEKTQGGEEKTARPASLFDHRERPNGGP